MNELFKNLGNQRLQMFHAIAEGFNDQNCNSERGQVLLELEPTIHREEYVELGSSQSEQLAILDSRPPGALHRDGLVTD